MKLTDVRKVVFQIDETHKEMNKRVETPPKKIIGAAVIKNQFANTYTENLEPLFDVGAEIGGYLAERCVDILQVKPDDIESYGKGAIVGVDGEIEHAAALLHPRFGAPVRSAVGSGKDIIPSTKKIGGPGSLIVMPMTNKNNIWDFDFMDATEISISDAPKADEISQATSKVADVAIAFTPVRSFVDICVNTLFFSDTKAVKSSNLFEESAGFLKFGIIILISLLASTAA